MPTSPAAAHLPALRSVSGWGNQGLLLTGAHLLKLAELPARDALEELKIAPGPALAPDVIAALKKFPRLRSVSLNAGAADDEALKRLPELGLTDFLGLTDLGKSAGATEVGHGAVAGLRLRRLTLATSPAAPAVLRLVPEGATYEELNFWNSPVGDDDLRELARLRRADRLVLHGTAVTDAGLRHLFAVPGLAFVDLDAAGVTEDGARALEASDRRFGVSRSGRTAEPKKP